MKKTDPLRSENAYPVIARYFKSGLCPHEFYKKEGWSDNQFSYWKKGYMLDHNMQTENHDPKSQFHPITEADTSQPNLSEYSGQTIQIEIEYPNGVLLRVEGKLNDSRIAGLIQLY
ncbi:MAG: hypothetical protein LBH58_11810 [Tannerellaceae bacterium]|jgi:hypothetical protein|nr:hypothetical protein [Tannerellaceae bacterium]